MARICLETAAEKNDRLNEIALYFEIWLLRLAGYLPFWDKCYNCHRELAKNEHSNLQINFHLLCRECQKSKNGFVLTAEQRQIFLTAQVSAPGKF